MTPYLITAQPNRRQKLYRAARHVAIRSLITAGMLLLGAATLLARLDRVRAHALASALAKAELVAAERAGTLPFGQVAGAATAAAFAEEFRTAYATDAA